MEVVEGSVELYTRQRQAHHYFQKAEQVGLPLHHKGLKLDIRTTILIGTAMNIKWLVKGDNGISFSKYQLNKDNSSFF